MLVSQETVDTHLRVPCSSRMPAQVGTATCMHSETLATSWKPYSNLTAVLCTIK